MSSHRTQITHQEVEFYRTQNRSIKAQTMNNKFEKKSSLTVFRRDVIQHEIDFNRVKVSSPKSIKSGPTSPLSTSIQTTIERKKVLFTPILQSSPSRDLSSQMMREERSLSPSTTTRSSKSSRSKRSSFSADILTSVESFSRATNGMQKDIQKFKANDYNPIDLPQWDDRFVTADSLKKDPFNN